MQLKRFIENSELWTIAILLFHSAEKLKRSGTETTDEVRNAHGGK
jgi:hypothetical protein